MKSIDSARLIRFVRPFVSVAVFLAFLAAIAVSILMVSAGILAIPISVGIITGLFTSVASDLSPPAMFFAGVFCLSGGLAIAVAIVILFPKQPNILRRVRK
jgi:hypothetical protein